MLMPHRVRRWIVPALVAALVLVLGASLASAGKRTAPSLPGTPGLPGIPGLPGSGGTWPAEYEGQPNLVVRAQPAYYVWFDQRGWHVRFATPVISVFSGSVFTDGKFERVVGATLQSNALLNFLRPSIRGAAAGFDFDTTGNLLTFNLNINQKAASRDQIYIGRKGGHPSRMPFTVARTGVAGVTTLGTKDPTWEKPRPCGGGCD